MEKRGVIKDGITKPESTEKQAQAGKPQTPKQLEEHTSKRTADQVSSRLKKSN